MPLLETKGAASAQGFGGAGAGASGLVTYIEDVFSTYLIKTPGSATAVGSINNAIDLSTKGGMVWLKDRSFAYDHTLVDSQRGVTQRLISNSTAAQASTSTYGFTSFNTNGFTLGAGGGALFDNGSAGTNLVTWTFRKQPKFFDVVTWTGNDTPNRKIAHSLGSVPGCIVVKSISNPLGWPVYHRSLNIGSNEILYLEQTAAATPTGASRFGDNASIIAPTSTEFTIGGAGDVNANGYTYVAYLFAHNAGGFGLSGSDNVISCGSFTGNTTVNLGYEPQWLLIKNYAGIDSWTIMDNMRGMPNPGNSVALLRPNTSGAEGVGQGAFPTATGFTTTGYSGLACIYIAIRRGPMKVPTSGTSVFAPLAQTGEAAFNNSFPVDLVMERNRTSGALGYTADRLRGGNLSLSTTSTAAEFSGGPAYFDSASGTFRATFVGGASPSVVYENFGRAPGFFDVVCYTGTGVARTVTHNLAAVPELMIVKTRNANGPNWMVYSNTGTLSQFLILNGADSFTTSTNLWNASPTSTQFSLAGSGTYYTYVNNNGDTYVAYLFATCAGVSKVGSYTGTGALQTINCGFTGGARFVLIKRTDSTGDWYVYDSARGISSGNDPYLFLNSTAAEVTGTNYVDTTSVGFQVTAAAPAGLNASGGSFVFLAIA